VVVKCVKLNKMVFNALLRVPSSFILGGPSQCGKTTWTLNLLRRAHVLFEDPRVTQNIVYYYKEWQEGFELFNREGLVKSWVDTMPTVEDFKERTKDYKESGGSIVIFDDYGQYINKDMAEVKNTFWSL
jgi:hypothetical protein